MPSTIVFKNHTAYQVRDGATRHDPKIEKEIDSLLPFFNAPIEVEEGILFDDIWRYIEKDYAIYNVIFSEALGGFDLKLYVDQFKLPSKSREDEDPENHMATLEVEWDIEINRWNGKDELYILASFGGYGPQKHPIADGKEWKGEGGWAIDLNPINDFKGMPFRIKTDYSLHLRDLGAYKTGGKTHQEISPKITTTMTVYDMLYAIFFEISYHGKPNDQLKMIHEMDQRIAELGEITFIEYHDLNWDDDES